MSLDLLTCRSFQEHRGGPTSYVSSTRLNLWLRCPLAFRLKYVDGVEVPTSPPLFLGKIVHMALEHYYRQRQLGIRLPAGEVTRWLEASWPEAVEADTIRFESSSQQRQCCRQAVDLVGAYLAWVPADEPPPAAVEAAMEAPLVDPATGEDLGIPLVGIVDLVVDAPGGPVICDFKTAARGGTPLEISHEIQLSAYAYLLRQLTETTESGLEIRSLIKTKTPRIERHPYPARSERHFRRLFAALRAYLDGLDAGRFLFRPGLACSFCDHRDTHCRDWQG